MVMRVTTMSSFSVFTVLGCLSLACGSVLPPPNGEYEAAQQDMGRAEAGGAPSVPDARLHLQLAQEDLQKSKDMSTQDGKRAASLLYLARTEAQLALSLAKASQAQDTAQKAQQDLQKAKSN
jgi:hypothetical protein